MSPPPASNDPLNSPSSDGQFPGHERESSIPEARRDQQHAFEHAVNAIASGEDNGAVDSTSLGAATGNLEEHALAETALISETEVDSLDPISSSKKISILGENRKVWLRGIQLPDLKDNNSWIILVFAVTILLGNGGVLWKVMGSNPEAAKGTEDIKNLLTQQNQIFREIVVIVNENNLQAQAKNKSPNDESDFIELSDQLNTAKAEYRRIEQLLAEREKRKPNDINIILVRPHAPTGLRIMKN